MDKLSDKKVIKRKFKGTVVSDKMDKTIVVRVERTKFHSKYGKIYVVSKNYKVHDPQNKFKVGEVAEFVECRPISREKKWKVVDNAKLKMQNVK